MLWTKEEVHNIGWKLWFLAKSFEFVMFRKHREDQGDNPVHFPAHIRLGSKVHNQYRSMHKNILGTHSFPTFSHHKECQHGPLPATDRKPYMEPGFISTPKQHSEFRKCINQTVSPSLYFTCQVIPLRLFQGSLALKKVTDAVLGAQKQNFEDLEHYSGGKCSNVYNCIV